MATAHPNAPTWTEPTHLLPLRWGDASTRWWAGGWLIVGGGTVIAGSNDVALWALAMGAAAHGVGWMIVPSAGWRRMLALPLSMLASFLLLAGPRFTFVIVIPYLCWLIARHRPVLTWLTALPVLAVTLITGDLYQHDYTRMLPALAIIMVAIVLSLWLASRLAQLIAIRRARGSAAATPPSSGSEGGVH